MSNLRGLSPLFMTWRIKTVFLRLAFAWASAFQLFSFNWAVLNMRLNRHLSAIWIALRLRSIALHSIFTPMDCSQLSDGQNSQPITNNAYLRDGMEGANVDALSDLGVMAYYDSEAEIWWHELDELGQLICVEHLNSCLHMVVIDEASRG